MDEEGSNAARSWTAECFEPKFADDLRRGEIFLHLYHLRYFPY